MERIVDGNWKVDFSLAVLLLCVIEHLLPVPSTWRLHHQHWSTLISETGLPGSNINACE